MPVNEESRNIFDPSVYTHTLLMIIFFMNVYLENVWGTNRIE